MCGSLAEGIYSSICEWPCAPAPAPAAADLELWSQLHATEYGSYLGADGVAG